jgi:hypothetical protein
VSQSTPHLVSSAGATRLPRIVAASTRRSRRQLERPKWPGGSPMWRARSIPLPPSAGTERNPRRSSRTAHSARQSLRGVRPRPYHSNRHTPVLGLGMQPAQGAPSPAASLATLGPAAAPPHRVVRRPHLCPTWLRQARRRPSHPALLGAARNRSRNRRPKQKQGRRRARASSTGYGGVRSTSRDDVQPQPAMRLPSPAGENGDESDGIVRSSVATQRKHKRPGTNRLGGLRRASSEI